MKNEFTAGNPLIYLISYRIVTVCEVFFFLEKLSFRMPSSLVSRLRENFDAKREKWWKSWSRGEGWQGTRKNFRGHEGGRR